MSGLLLLIGLSAHAGEPAHYFPDKVAAASTRFAQAAVVMAPAFDAAQAQLASLGRDLQALEMGLAMAGDAAPDGMAGWADETRRSVNVGFIKMQRHAALLQDDYATQFGGALERAIAESGRAPVECGATGIRSISMRGGGNKCVGEDLNGALAKAVDADAALAKAVEEINSIPWPAVDAEPREWPAIPLTGTAKTVQADALMRAFAGGALARHEDALDRLIAPLEDDIADGDADALAAAKGHRADYDAARARDGAALRAAATDALTRMAKKGDGPTDVGLCANPIGLGGCAGEDATKAVIAALKASKRFQKATADLR